MSSYIGGKYVPLRLVFFPSLSVILAILVLVMPATLFLNGVPFQNWAPAFVSVSLWGFVMISFFSLMAWVFCELFASSLSKIKSALLFGLVSPFALIFILTLAAYFDGNNFLAGFNTKQGIQNLMYLGGTSFVLAVVVYWQSAKST